jgi:hypothetical protein
MFSLRKLIRLDAIEYNVWIELVVPFGLRVQHLDGFRRWPSGIFANCRGPMSSDLDKAAEKLLCAPLVVIISRLEEEVSLQSEAHQIPFVPHEP